MVSFSRDSGSRGPTRFRRATRIRALSGTVKPAMARQDLGRLAHGGGVGAAVGVEQRPAQQVGLGRGHEVGPLGGHEPGEGRGHRAVHTAACSVAQITEWSKALLATR